MEFFLFYLFSSLLLFSASCVVFSTNPVIGVFHLILAFCNASGLLLLCEVEFLALAFLVVYVGAVAILFVFVIMMLNLKGSFYSFSLKQTFTTFSGYLPVSFLLIFTFFFEIFALLTHGHFPFFSFPLDLAGTPSHVEWVFILDSLTHLEIFGQLLYTYFVVFFLLTGFILILALVGPIALTTKNVSGSSFLKKQKVFQQLSRSVEGAVFLVSIKKLRCLLKFCAKKLFLCLQKEERKVLPVSFYLLYFKIFVETGWILSLFL